MSHMFLDCIYTIAQKSEFLHGITVAESFSYRMEGKVDKSLKLVTSLTEFIKNATECFQKRGIHNIWFLRYGNK